MHLPVRYLELHGGEDVDEGIYGEVQTALLPRKPISKKYYYVRRIKKEREEAIEAYLKV
jgi:hypothetical protein